MKHNHHCEHEEVAPNPVCACRCDCKVTHGEHNLGFCSRCDSAYCTACKKEWGTYSTYTPYITTICDSSGTGGVSYVPTACSHA